MKTTRSLLNVFSQTPSKSTRISLSPSPTLPTHTPMSKAQLLQVIRTSLSLPPTLPTKTPISKLNCDEDHNLQEILTYLKTNPPNKATSPLEESLFLPSIFLPLLHHSRMNLQQRYKKDIISQKRSKSMPISLSPSPTLSTQTQTPIFKTNPPIKASSLFEMEIDERLLTRQEYAQEYGIAVEAIQDFRRMMEDGSRRSHNFALTVLFKEEMFDVAMAIYGDMLKRNFPRDCKTFNCVIDGLGKAGKIQDAIHLFDEMAEIGISPDTTTYTNLLNGFCKLHRMDEAFMFLSSFLKKGYVVSLNGYCCMIDGLFGTGRFEEACKYYKNLLEDNILPDLTVYRIMIKGYTEAGKIDDGFGFLKKLSSMSLVPDPYCYSILFKCLVDVGLRNMAQLFVKYYILNPNFISDSPIQPTMVAWLCKAGFVQEAWQIFDKMVREERCIKIAKALVASMKKNMRENW